MGPLSSPDGAVLEIIGNRKELKHSIGGELHGASTTSSGFDMAISSIFNIPQLISRFGFASRLLHFNLPAAAHFTPWGCPFASPRNRPKSRLFMCLTHMFADLKAAGIVSCHPILFITPCNNTLWTLRDFD
jgi:hypothetical protein